jgi:hypothetical protein
LGLEYRIYPLANGDFYEKNGSSEWVFTKDLEGNVTGCVGKDDQSFAAEKLDYKKPIVKTGTEIPPPP